jgi:site-specific recombinase XerD
MTRVLVNYNKGAEKMGDLVTIKDNRLQTQDLQQNPAAVYLSSLSEKGRRAMVGRLLVVVQLINAESGFNFSIRTVPWHGLHFQGVAAIRTRLQEMGYSPGTVNLTLYALRGVARAAFNLGQMSAEDYQRIKEVRPVKNHKLPSGRGLTPGEIQALMEACMLNGRPAGARDAAIIGLLYAAGLRRAEVVALDLADYNQETGDLVIRGKGRKERLLFVNNGAADALKDWLAERGQEPGPLFLPINKSSKIYNRRMTDQAVYTMLKLRAQQAGVKDFSPHDLRRSFVSDLLDAGADISTVQHLAGHANVQTTARYDRRGDEAKRKAIDLLHIPYRRRVRKEGS